MDFIQILFGILIVSQNFPAVKFKSRSSINFNKNARRIAINAAGDLYLYFFVSSKITPKGKYNSAPRHPSEASVLLLICFRLLAMIVLHPFIHNGARAAIPDTFSFARFGAQRRAHS